MPPLPPITSRIVSRLESIEAALRTYHATNSRMFMGSVAAAVVAPLLMKNDERGYFSTATITTPLIAAGAAVAPTLFPAINSERKRLIDIIKKVPSDYGFTAGGDVMQAYAGGRMGVGDSNAAKLANLRNLPEREINVAKEYDDLKTAFFDTYENAVAKRRLLDNAVFRANLDRASAAEKAEMEVKAVGPVAPSYSSAELEGIFGTHQRDVDWIRKVNYFLRSAEGTEFADPAGVPTVADLITPNEDYAHIFGFDTSDGRKLLGKHTREFERLNQLLQDQAERYSPSDFSILALPNPQGKGMVAHGIRLTKGKKSLNFALDHNGAIRFGNNLQNYGVSRSFLTHAGERSAAEQVIHALRFGSTVEDAMDLAKAERDRAQYFIGGDEIARRNRVLVGGNELVASNLPNDFDIEKKDLGGFNVMRPEEKLAETTYMIEKRGFSRVTTESDLDRFDRSVLRLADSQGVYNKEAASLAVKAANQDGHAIEAAGGQLAYSTNDFLDAPRFGARMYELSDAQTAFFQQLPEWEKVMPLYIEQLKKRTAVSPITLELLEHSKAVSMDIALTQLKVRSHMLNTLMAEMGTKDKGAVDSAWLKFLSSVGDREHYEAARKLQYVGDGSRVMRDMGDVYSITRGYKVHENFLSKAQLEGEAFVGDARMGVHFGTPVMAYKDGTHRVVGTGSSLNDDGSLTVQIESRFGVGGAKTVQTNKQTVLTVSGKEVDQAAEVLQAFHDATGQGGRIADNISGFAQASQTSAKAKNPLEMIEDLLGGAFRDISQTDNEGLNRFLDASHGETGSYRSQLSAVGLQWDGSQLNRITSAYAAHGDASRSAYTGTSGLLYKIMDSPAGLGSQIEKGSLKASPYLAGFADWKARETLGFSNYLRKFGKTESLMVSDHMAINHAERVKFTREMYSQLDAMGFTELTKDMMANTETERSVPMATDFLRHIQDHPKMDVSLGPSVSLDQAIGSKSLSLGSAEARAETIFDPGLSGADKNFSIPVKFGDKTYHVPVPGHEAHRAGVNEYGMFGYSANEVEGPLRDLLVNARDQLALAAKMPEGMARAELLAGSEKNFLSQAEKYFQAGRSHIGLGKEGVLRAPAYHKYAYEGRITARTSSLRYEDGSINPFQIAVGEDYLQHMPKGAAKALRDGEALFGPALRHPINAPIPVQIVFDRNLGPMQVGVDQRLEMILKGDGDGDRIAAALAMGNHLSPEGRDAFKKAINDSILSPDSIHGQYYKMHRVLHGDEEFTSSTGFTSWFGEKIQAFADKAEVAAVHARTSGSNTTVGQSHNLFELLENSILHNNRIRDPFQKTFAHISLFDLVKQASISAQKHGGEGELSNFQKLMGWNNRLRGTLTDLNEANYEKFLGSLRTSAGVVGKKEISVNDLHVQMGLATAQEQTAGTKINPYMRIIDTHKDGLLRDVFFGHDHEIEPVQQVLSMTGDRAENYTGPIISTIEGKNIFPNIQAATGMRSSAADAGAAAIGQMNEETKGARQFMGKVRRAAGGVFGHTTQSVENVIKSTHGTGASRALKIGAGVAIGAGLMFGSIHSPREGQALAPSGNQHRPEERIGVDGRIPGEPEEGAMAPANPPRHVRSPRQGVRTAVAAPMGRATQLEVQMRADDRDRAAELSRIASRMSSSDGHSNVNITYRDGTRLDSLRTREKIRETMRNA